MYSSTHFKVWCFFLSYKRLHVSLDNLDSLNVDIFFK